MPVLACNIPVFSSLFAATYYNVDVVTDKVLERLDDILLRPGFLEVGPTRAVTFLNTRKRRNKVTVNACMSGKAANDLEDSVDE